MGPGGAKKHSPRSPETELSFQIIEKDITKDHIGHSDYPDLRSKMPQELKAERMEQTGEGRHPSANRKEPTLPLLAMN